MLVEWWRRSEHYARRNLQLRDRMAEMAWALEDAGIACLPYKGAVLAEAFYGAAGLRAFDDIDILIRPCDLERAAAVLQSHGYVRYYQLDRRAAQAMRRARLQYHLVFTGGSPEHLLELHWKTDPTAAVERDSDQWWRDLQRVSVADRELRALSAEDTLLINAVHAMRHHGYRLCWLVDIAEQLRGARPIDWPSVFRRAREIRASRRLVVALLMARDVLDAPLPGDAAAAARADVRAAKVAAQLQHRLFQPDSGQLSSAERTQIDLAMCDSWADRMRFAWSVLFEPSFHEVTAWPLPRVLTPLYVPLRAARLIGKYGARKSSRTGQTARDARAGGGAAPE